MSGHPEGKHCPISAPIWGSFQRKKLSVRVSRGVQGPQGRRSLSWTSSRLCKTPSHQPCRSRGQGRAVPYMYPKATSFSCPTSQGSFPPWGHQPHSNFRDLRGGRCFPRESRFWLSGQLEPWQQILVQTRPVMASLGWYYLERMPFALPELLKQWNGSLQLRMVRRSGKVCLWGRPSQRKTALENEEGRLHGQFIRAPGINQAWSGCCPGPVRYRRCMSLPWLLYQIGEGNGTPLQYSCLENPMDGGAW